MKKVMFVALIEDVYNQEMYTEYIKKVRPIIQSHHGEYIVKSNKISQFAGPRPKRVIIISFGSMEQAKNCFFSKEYIKIQKLRESSTKSNAFFIEHD